MVRSTIGRWTCFAAAAVLELCATPACAQATVDAFSQLKGRLVIGRAVTVTDTSGRRVVGRLTDISEASLRLLVEGTTRTFTAEDTQRIQQRRRDSLTNGLLIGAAAGAGYAVYWYLRDPNECGGSVCASDLALGVGLGALIGLAIDAAIRENVTVYVAPGPAGTQQRTSPAALTGTAIRVALAIRW